ncbi:MAG: N-acetylglucosamine-6-phosphate deacetylase [Syntrophorhabdus sp. PtaB.Bin047]|jgi:N-acetylglucosamine-6-phosphate deacetylase|nr:MAG: N-acetylglucosamine-6-phosphate deacetylase [Syntrophorhabdus sp. PtaB.Bin047]
MIDLHTHGLGGYGTRGASPGDILAMAGLQGSAGVEAILPTIFSAPIDEMRRDISAVREAMRTQREDRENTGIPQSARITGVHLEGPFLNPAEAGALDRGSFLPADADTWRRLVEGFEDIVRVVTIAPELEGATGLISDMAGMGVIVSMGHSDAIWSEAEAGFRAGARGVTHIFNAMRGFHHREPGIAGFALMNPDVYVEVIADPYHLDLRTIELIFRVKDPGRILLVSDTVKGSPCSDEGRPVTDDKGRLLGGSMPLPASVARLLLLGFDREAVARAATENPATYLGLSRIAGNVHEPEA